MSDFIELVAPIFQKYGENYNMGEVVSLGIAGACLESNFGTSELAQNANNLLGRKHRGTGELYIKRTREFMPETPVEEAIAAGFEPIIEEPGWYTKPLPFIAYPSWEDCIEDYFINIATRDIYREVFELRFQYDGYRMALGAKYATDGRYADKLDYIVSRYNLRQYDRVSSAVSE